MSTQTSSARLAGMSAAGRAHAGVPASLFDETLATHRAAIVTCVEEQLAEALVDLQGVRKRAREVRAAIAMIKGERTPGSRPLDGGLAANRAATLPLRRDAIDSLSQDWGCGMSTIVPFPAVGRGRATLEHVAQQIVDALGPSAGLRLGRLAPRAVPQSRRAPTGSVGRTLGVHA